MILYWIHLTILFKLNSTLKIVNFLIVLKRIKYRLFINPIYIEKLQPSVVEVVIY